MWTCIPESRLVGLLAMRQARLDWLHEAEEPEEYARRCGVLAGWCDRLTDADRTALREWDQRVAEQRAGLEWR